MGKYRIRVESINGSEDLDEDYMNGIECNGFAILADKDGIGKAVAAMHNINIMTLAAMMQSNEAFRAAHKLITMINLMDNLTGGAVKNEPDEKDEFLKRVIGSLNED
jgi:hypothetical protein